MWFKKGGSAAKGPVARPISIERVCAAFDEQGWGYDFNAESAVLSSTFDDISFRIITNGPHLLATIICATDNLTADRLGEFLAWIKNYHDRATFPTVVALYDPEDSNLLRMGADFALPGAWDYTDAQLHEWLHVAIMSIVEVATAFFEEFDPQFLERVRAANRGEA